MTMKDLSEVLTESKFIFNNFNERDKPQFKHKITSPSK